MVEPAREGDSPAPIFWMSGEVRRIAGAGKAEVDLLIQRD